MKRAVLVTLADKKYLEYAKQVFAGAYFNAGWKGDFLLLAYNIPDKKLEWFYRKGIYVQKCPIFLKKRNKSEINIIHYSKFYLLSEDFKKWSHVIFLDIDTLIRSPLDHLLKVKTFAAVPNLQIKFGSYFKKNNIFNKYIPQQKTFCSGIMVFNTKIIKSKTFDNAVIKIKKYEKYKILSKDEAFFNLIFYNNWQKLPRVYNVCTDKNINLWHIPNNQLSGIIIHTASQSKPWREDSYFNREWVRNYARADRIYIQGASGEKMWSKFRIITLSYYLNIKYIFHIRLDYLLWQIEKKYFNILNYIEKKYPILFQKLKKTKARLKSKL